MRLYPHLCAALNFISYDKRHDARPVPSDGNPIALTPMFCLSESDTFYLYPIRLTTGQNGTERDRSVSRKATRCSIYQDGPLSLFPCPLYGAHHVITSGGQRSILRIRRVGVLATCPLPRVQPVVDPATISEVLLEVVDCHHTDLSRKPVVDFHDDVILGFHDQFLYVSCIHWHCLGIAVNSAISRK